MAIQAAIPLPLEQIAAFCRERGITRLEVFGSVLTPEFTAESDVDFLFTLHEDAHPAVWHIVGWERELGELLGRRVDLMSRDAIERSTNPIRRTSILESAQVVYAEP